MAMTLEMPATDLDSNFSPQFNDDAASVAADLLERGEAEVGSKTSAEYETHCPKEIPNSEGLYRCEVCGAAEMELSLFTCDEYKAEHPPAVTESNGQPEKKKRTRKPKKESAPDANLQLNTEPASIPIDTPAVAEQLVKAETSRSTRLIEIARVENEYVNVTLEINGHEDAIDYAKAEVKRLSEQQRALAIELRSLRGGNAWQPRLPYPENEQTSYPSSPPAAAVEGSASQATTALPAEPDIKTVAAPDVPASVTTAPDGSGSTAAANGDWKNEAVAVLGLPPKLADKLAGDGIYTVGDLEARRAGIKASSAVWPKGIGAAKVALIEDAANKWLEKQSALNASPEVKQPAGKQPEPSSPKSAPQSVASKSPASRPAADSITKEAIEHAAEQTDEEYAAELNACVAAVNTGEANCLDRKHPDGDAYWSSGYEAYGRQFELLDCPYVPGPEREDWVRGYLAAKTVDQYEPAAAAAGAAEIKSDDSQLVTLDEL